MDKPIQLSSHRILYRSIQIRVPENISAGTYSLQTLVNSSRGDYMTGSDVTVNRLQAIPFSGDIPLSVLVLVFSGAVTYIIIIYIISRKFERSYLELGLYSVGLGFVNWFIASQLHLVHVLESINSEPLEIIRLIVIATIIGLIAGSVIKATQLFIAWIIRRNKTIRDFRERRRKGYYRDPRPVWIIVLQQELDSVKQNLGRNYSIALKVHLKKDYELTTNIEGIVIQYEEGRPYDLFISPKRVVQCNSADDIIRLLREDPSPLENLLLKDQEYYTKIHAYLGTGANVHEVRQGIINRLELNHNNDEFISILEKIDFSRYVKHYMEIWMRENNLQPILEYPDATVFIPGDNIAGIEIIRYDTFYAFRFTHNNRNQIVPRSYERVEFPHIRKVVL